MNGLEYMAPLAIFGTVFLIIVGFALIPKIFFLLTLNRTFDEISPQNRLMPGAQVWLALIPIFNLVWNFVIVQKLADSLEKEFADRNIEVREQRPAYNIGLAWAILNCCTIIPFFGFLASLGALICWIIFWVNAHEYKTTLYRSKLEKA